MTEAKKVQAYSEIMTGVQQWKDKEITTMALQDGIWQVIQRLTEAESDEERVYGDLDGRAY